VIQRRARELRALGEQKSAAFRHCQIGRTLQVLTLHRSANDRPAHTPALSENYLSVMIPEVLPHNCWLTVRATHADGKHLIGRPQPIREMVALGA